MHGRAPEEEVLAGRFTTTAQGARPVPSRPGVGGERRWALAALAPKQMRRPLSPMCGNVGW
eukprot:3641135-Alexandrium_andersonii.AAC.1